MIGIVITTAELKIEDVNGVYLLDDTVVLADTYLVDDGRRRTEEDTLKEVTLLGQLNLHNDVLASGCLCLHIDTVGFVLKAVFVVLALKDLSNGHCLAKKHSYQSFKHFLVRLVAKDALDGPIETYISAVLCHGGKVKHLF